jgi:RNA polymerase sigma-70 factor (ECF subfamily)
MVDTTTRLRRRSGPPARDCSLNELLERIALGDESAFDETYLRLARWVMSVVQQQLVDRNQSEEVTQEVFLEIWQLAARFTSKRGNATTWIHTIARRRAIDRVRASQASRDRDRVVGVRDLQIPHDQVWERMEMLSDRDSLRNAIERIPVLQREAVMITYLSGYTAPEAANMLGTSVTAVKSRQLEGIRSLRRHFAKLSPPHRMSA